jgi:hypothetical protein
MSDKQVEEMIAKAAGADKADDAMKFAQAALNATNALMGLAALRGVQRQDEVQAKASS